MKIVNKTHTDRALNLKVLSHGGKIEIAGSKIFVEDQGMFQTTFILYLPKEEVKKDKMTVDFGIFEEDKLIETVKVTFVGPRD